MAARRLFRICAGLFPLALAFGFGAPRALAQSQPVLVSGDSDEMLLANGDVFQRSSRDQVWRWCSNILLSAGVPGGTTKLVGALGGGCSAYAICVDSGGTMYKALSCDICASYQVSSNIFDMLGEPRGRLTYAGGAQLGAIAFSETGTVYRGTAIGGQPLVWTSEGNVFASLLGVGGPTASRLAIAVTPSPSRQRIGFTYHLPSDGPVEITLHDVQGRLLDRIELQTASVGSHSGEFAFDGPPAPLAAGTYFVRIRAGGLNETSKATLIK